MAIAAAIAALLTILAVAPLVAAEIKTLAFASDPRDLILLETFAFAPAGGLNLTITSPETSPETPTSSETLRLLGFFLVSDDSLLRFAQNPRNPQNPSCLLDSPYVQRLLTLADLSPAPAAGAGEFSRFFPVSRPDEYSLFFVNCVPGTRVSMLVRTEMFNVGRDGRRDYLSIGYSAVPSIYAVFAVAYLVFCGLWGYLTLVRNRGMAHRIHHLMTALLVAKALNLVFAAEDQHYIRQTGTPHGWDVLFYIFQFVKGVLLFTVIVLVGTGWSFLKPFLQDREKKVIMIVIPLQVVANIASVVVGETGPFFRDWVTWTQLLLLVDVVCCCAVLFPIIWSIRSLRETSKTDGKAARNLAKLTLFRQFYLVVIGYLYFTRIVVYALKTITSYKYRWVSVAAEELASLAFYIFMFYMFMPVEKNQYFALDEDEEELAEQALRDDEFEL